MATHSLTPHDAEALVWPVAAGDPSTTSEYAASIPPLLGKIALALSPETIDACSHAALEIAVASRVRHDDVAHARASAALLNRVETLASCLLEGYNVSAVELAQSEANIPTKRNARYAAGGVAALVAHVAAADRALGLGAMAAAHVAPSAAPGGPGVARYRTAQTWLGGSDLWPAGADYIPPRPERVPALLDDLVQFSARTDVDPIAQAAVAHAQLLSIQPFEGTNGRTARVLMNGAWRRRGLTRGQVVPISVAIAGDRHRYDSAWLAYREGDADPLVSFVARHAVRAVREAMASADRMALMPLAWMQAVRPRRGSTAHALIHVLATHPIVTPAEVRRLTGASQASAYAAIAQLAREGVLRRLTVSKRDAVWVAGDVIDEEDRVVVSLGGTPHPREVWHS